MKQRITLIIRIILLVCVCFIQAQNAEWSQDYVDEFKNKATLDRDIEDGHDIFLDVIKPYVSYIKKKHHLQALPGPGRPSSDVNKFLEQTKEVYEDATSDYEDLVLVVGKYGAASFIDLFTSLQADEVAKDRKLLYDVIGEALATECFPQYDASTVDFSIGQKFIFYSVKYDASKLSNFEKYKLRVCFIFGATYSFSTFPRKDYFERDLDSYSLFMSHIRNYFMKSDTRYKD
tara:strand:- start:133 stop:828 length:696 start_codon:yes stop_codon:yes gene_type:complete